MTSPEDMYTEDDAFVEVDFANQKRAFIYGYKQMVVKEGTTDLVSLNYDQAKYLYKKGLKYKYEANEFGAKATKNMLLKLKNFIIDSGKDKELVLTPFKTNIKIMITWLEQNNKSEEDQSMFSFLKLALAYAPDNIYKNKKV